MRKWAKILLAAEFIYILGTSVFLNSKFILSQLNTDPNSLEIKFAYAYSWIPGRVYVKDFSLRVQDGNVQMHFEVDEAFAWVNVPLLFKRKFSTFAANVNHLKYHLRRRRDPGEVLAIHAFSLPPIAGFPSFLKDPPAPDVVSTEEPWHVDLHHVRVRHVNEIWVEEFRFIGEGTAGGGFFLRPGKEAFVRPSYLTAESGEITVAQKKMAQPLNVNITAEIDHFRKEEVPGLKILNFLTARFKAEAKMEGVDFLRYYLNKLPWLRLESGTSQFTADIGLKKGKLEPSTKVRLVSDSIQAYVKQQQVKGSGVINVKIETTKTPPEAQLALQLPNYEITQKEAAGKIVGKNFRLEVSSPDLQMSESFRHLAFLLDIPDAEVTQLEYFNNFFPKSSRFTFTGGKGKLKALIETSTKNDNQDHGQVTLTAEDAGIQRGKASLAGNLSVVVNLNKGKMETGDFDITGTAISLTTKDAWIAKGALETSQVRLGKPNFIRGKLKFKATDAKPLLTFLSPEGELPKVIYDKLLFKGLDFKTGFSITDHEFSLSDGVVSGEDSSAIGWFQDKSGRKIGRMLLQVGALAAGAEVKGDSTHVILQNASLWYHDNLPQTYSK